MREAGKTAKNSWKNWTENSQMKSVEVGEEPRQPTRIQGYLKVMVDRVVNAGCEGEEAIKSVEKLIIFCTRIQYKISEYQMGV